MRIRQIRNTTLGISLGDLYDEFSSGNLAAVDFSSAGTQSVTDEFTFTQSWQGEVLLEIPQQNFLASNSVSFTATCR